MSLTAGTLLGSYRVGGLLGAGGMGEVYRAHDTNLGRDVAIKVLPESVARDADALARFEREARAVAALSHPNIRGIHDLVHQGDLVFAVMELLDGEPLRARLQAGPLPQKTALDYALQAARGLAAAHERGIVHRDLKPENLFVTRDGFVKILDFGLAKLQAPVAREETSAPTATGHPAAVTSEGMVMGTLDYMSPEQVRGQVVDHRSDIFSFGSVLLELLTGRQAFHRGNVADTMSAITRDEPSGLEGLPAALGQIVRHCLEKRPEDRFQSVKDLAFDLAQEASGTRSAPVVAPVSAPPIPSRSRMLVLAGVALAIAALAVTATLLLRRRPAPVTPPAAETKRRIAVLPFENLGAADQDYFADGLADEVRTKLTALPTLEVIARGSSTPFRKTTKTPQQIAQELGVRYLLNGTVRWEKATGGGRVQVTPELVEVSKEGAPVSRWQERLETELTDVFKVQSDIAAKVGSALGLALGGAEQKRLAEKPTANLDAYDEYLKGEEAWKEGDAVPRSTIAHHEKAVALDPTFALAWASLGRARSVLYGNTAPSPELAAGAKEAAERALALAPERAASHIAMADYQRFVARDVPRSLDASEKALRLEPGSALALSSSALAFGALGRWELGVERLREALKADPLSVPARRRLGFALLYLRRIGEAREAFDRALELAPANPLLIEQRAMVPLAEGDLAGARAVVARAAPRVDLGELVTTFGTYWELGWALERDQRDLLLRLTPADFGDDRGAWALSLALEHHQRGDAKRSLELAAEAVKEFTRQVAASPQDAQLRAILGFALALAGRKADAIREGVQATEQVPVSKDAYVGPYLQHLLVRVYILTGETGKALDTLERLLSISYFLTPAWLKIDPTFEPLRGNPRFQQLLR